MIPVVFLGCLTTAFPQEKGQSEAELFRKMFGNQPQAPTEVTVPFTVDGARAGEINVRILADKEVEIGLQDLIAALEGKIQTETLSILRQRIEKTRSISLRDLRSIGINGFFDESSLELSLETAAEIRQESIVSLSGVSPHAAVTAVKPSLFSTYVNLRSGLDYVQQSANRLNEGFQPVRAELEGAVNLNDWVVEGSGGYAEDAPSLWRRGGFRLVRDDPERMIRYSAGDLAYPTAGFQVFQPLLGVTAARNFSLQPYRVTEPRGSTSFFLKSAARVEVFVNGQRVQTLQLPPGTHNIQDFLLASGGNDVVLRITDEVGRVETISLSFFFDARLLAHGEHEFSYSVGVPSRPGELGPEYDFDLPAVSLFHRVGLSDTITAGLNFQGNEKQQIMGADAVWATPLGTFQPDFAISPVEEFGPGWAMRLGYRYFDAASYWGSTFALSAQYTSPRFATLGNLQPANISAWNFSARYSQRLMWDMHGGIGGTYELRRRDPNGLTGINLFVGKKFRWNAFADLTLDRRETILGRTEYRAFITLTALLSGGRQSIRATHDTFLDATRTDWRFSSTRQAGGFDGNVGLQRTPDDYSLFGDARYTGYRGEASISQDITTPSNRDETVDSRTRLRFGTALVYADGQVALSRPVRDSFAIVTPHPQLKEQRIGVDPIREVYAAKIDRFGPAVVPDLNSYLYRNLTIDAPELPPGYELGPGMHTVRPTYRSGTVIEVGTGATVLIDGTLQTPEGTPVSLEAGEIISISDAKVDPVEFFTNRQGRFTVEGLKPGTYEIHLYAQPRRTSRFQIPEGKAGIYKIQTLTLKPVSSIESTTESGTGR